MAINYVRFQRGSKEAYKALKDANQLDPNTLYFIKATGSSVGALYMGEALISGGDTIFTSANLDDLADVIVTNAATDSFLVKASDGNWVAKNLNDVITLIKENLGDIASSAQVFQVVLNANETQPQAIERIVGDALISAGDMVVVKEAISEDRYQHTAYVFDNQTWVAMDGNYNAENVYFDNDLVLTYTFGRYAPDSSGRVTIPAKGINLQALLEDAYSSEVKTGLKTKDPAASVSGSIKYYEIGSTGTQDVTVTLSEDGEYKYGYSTSPATGNEGDNSVTVLNNKTTGVVVNTNDETPYSLTFNGQAINPKTAKGNVFTLSPVAQKEKTEMSVVGTVKHTSGGVPVSNLGKLYPSQVISSGSKSTSSAVRARWYIPMYHGFTYSDNVITNPAAIAPADFNKLTKITGENAYNEVQTTTATASKAWRQYFLAIPADYGWNMSNAKDGNNIDCTVRQAENVTMSFGSGDSAVDVIYNVFYINNAADYGTLTISWNLG